jgi:hypothetical protein
MRFKIFKYYYDTPYWPDKYPHSNELYCSIKAAQKALGVIHQTIIQEFSLILVNSI